MSRKSRSLRRVSSILKIEKDDETGVFGNRSKRNSRRVSFAETYQVKEIPRNSPKCYKDVSDSENEENQPPNNKEQGAAASITGLDKLLTGAIQTPYQNVVSECPMPEMSVDSFNIFDTNSTVLDPVDMDTTAAGGGICLQDMDFQTEPSTEIRIDHMAFLKTLSDSNSSLKPMQIYSPNREKQASVLSDRMNQSLQGTDNRSPLKGLNIQQSSIFNDHNKENIIVHADMLPLYKPAEEPQPLYDVKNFFNNLFAPKTSVSDVDENMDETNCYDGIQGDLYKSKLAKHLQDDTDSIRSEGFQYNDNNMTTVFGGNTGANCLEETRCIGGILNQSLSENPQFRESDITMNMTVAMEMTKPIGLGVGSKACDTTLNMTVPMEMTKPVGLGVGSKAPNTTLNMTVPMEMTKPVGLGVGSKAPDATLNMTVPMEMTKPVGVRVGSKAPDTTLNITVPMEITRPVGLIAESADVAFMKATSTDSALNVSVRSQINMSHVNINHTGVVVENFAQDMEDEEMEETKPLPGVIENMSFDATLSNKTLAMEETKMVGGIMNRSSVSRSISPSENAPANNTQTLNSQITANIAKDRTGNLTIGMEETVAVGGILNSSAIAPYTNSPTEDINQPDHTKNITMCMEETRALGAILKPGEETIYLDKVSKAVGDNERTVCIGDAMEETRPLGGLVKDFGKKLAETSILERTITFEKFDADWTASQLKQNKSINVEYEKAKTEMDSSIGDSISARSDRQVANLTTFEPVSMEETRLNASRNLDTVELRLDSAETANMSVLERSKYKQLSHTIIEPHTMEETKCVTGVLQINNDDVPEHDLVRRCEITFSNKPDSDHKQYENDIIADEDIIFKKSSVDVTAEMDLTNIGCTNYTLDAYSVSPGNKQDSEANDPLIKASNKRSYGVIRETGTDIEKTVDLTQTQTQLVKLREMLINSKKKTAEHLRTGDLRTPSKLLQSKSSSKYAPTVLKSTVSTGSPASKKQRVESEGLNVSLGNMSRGSPADLSLLDKAVGDFEGIDEEQMPDEMRDLHGTICSIETQSEHSQAMSDQPSSENKTSSSINMSLVSNKSFATSFNIPEGPLTLESFYSLTIRPPTKVNRGRCSVVFSPKVDMENLEEVLAAQLSVKPLVESKKAVEKSMLEKISFNKDTQEWLQKTLEETQPQIFNDCSRASADELQKLRDELRILSKCCRDSAATTWKQDTAKMVKDTMVRIKNESTQKADSILKDIQDTSDSMDQMLTALDTEMAELDETEKQLVELQQRQESLSQKLESSVNNLEEKYKMADKLKGELTHVEEGSALNVEREKIRQQVLTQLMCVDWTLDEFQDEYVVFTFNNEQLELQIDFVPLTKQKTIKHIALRQKQTQDNLDLYEELCQSMIVGAVDTESLLNNYQSFTDLPQILSEVSAVVTEMNQFYTDVAKINFRHKLKVTKNRVDLELWSVETLDLIKLGLVFDDKYPLSNNVSSEIQISQGNLRLDTLQQKIASVTPGRKYLSRLIETIDFKTCAL